MASEAIEGIRLHPLRISSLGSLLALEVEQDATNAECRYRAVLWSNNEQADVPANPRSRRDTDSDNTVYKEVHFSKGFQQKQDLCELKG